MHVHMLSSALNILDHTILDRVLSIVEYLREEMLWELLCDLKNNVAYIFEVMVKIILVTNKDSFCLLQDLGQLIILHIIT